MIWTSFYFFLLLLNILFMNNTFVLHPFITISFDNELWLIFEYKWTRKSYIEFELLEYSRIELVKFLVNILPSFSNKNINMWLSFQKDSLLVLGCNCTWWLWEHSLYVTKIDNSYFFKMNLSTFTNTDWLLFWKNQI